MQHSESEIEAFRELLKIEHADGFGHDQDLMDLLEELWDEFLNGYARRITGLHVDAPFCDPIWDGEHDKLTWYLEECWYNNITGNIELNPKVVEYFVSLLDAAGVKHSDVAEDGSIVIWPPQQPGWSRN